MISWTLNSRSKCDPSGPHYLEVTWDNKADIDTDEIDLQVNVEPGVLDDPGEESATPAEFSEPSSEQDIVWAGGLQRRGGAARNGAVSGPSQVLRVQRLQVWPDWGRRCPTGSRSSTVRTPGGRPR